VTETATGHFLRDLGCSHLLTAPDRALLALPAGPHLAGPAGAPVGLAVLATAVDIVTSDPAMATCPADWMATRALSLHATGHATGHEAGLAAVGQLVVDARLVRAGSSGVVVSAEVYADPGLDVALTAVAAVLDTTAPPAVATALVDFARITRDAAPTMADYTPAAWIGQVRRVEGGAVGPGTVYERMEPQQLAPGVVVCAASPYVTNAIGTVTGGAQAALAELAATSLVPHAVAADLQRRRRGAARCRRRPAVDAGDGDAAQPRLTRTRSSRRPAISQRPSCRR